MVPEAVLERRHGGMSRGGPVRGRGRSLLLVRLLPRLDDAQGLLRCREVARDGPGLDHLLRFMGERKQPTFLMDEPIFVFSHAWHVRIRDRAKRTFPLLQAIGFQIFFSFIT